MADEKQIKRAAKMAGEWWAAKLSDKHADKRDALATAVAKLTEQELSGVCHWDWWGKRIEGVGNKDRARIEFDYGPHYLLIAACEEVGLAWPANRQAFPTKTELTVRPYALKPKEGYGNWTDDILVPEEG